MSSVSNVDGGYSYYQKPLDDLEADYKEETKKLRDRYNERSDRLEKKTGEALEKQNKRSEEATDQIRNTSAQRNAQSREDAREQVERDRALTYDRYGRSQAEQLANKKQSEAMVQSAVDSADHRVKKANSTVDGALDKQAHGYTERLEDNAFKDKMSREKETSELRRDIHTLSDSHNNYLKEKGAGTTEAYRELENEFNARNESTERQHALENQRNQEQVAMTDRHNTEVMDQSKKERDAYYTGLIGKQEREHQMDRKQTFNKLEKMEADHQMMLRKQQSADENHLEQYAKRSDEAKTEALEHQNEAFKAEMHQMREQDGDKMSKLEKDLLMQRTSPDDTFISPAAEKKFRESVALSYDKNFEAERNRNKEQNNSMQENFSKKVVETNNDAQKKLYDTVSQRQLQEHLDRQTYMANLDDMQKNHEAYAKNKESESSRTVEHVSRNYESAMDHQRRELEEQYNDARNNSAMKITDLKQQHDFEARMTQKDFATRQAEIIRGYEKKLEEQKAQSDYQISNMKETMAHQHNESERSTKQLLEGQSKGYEQKIAQLEYASKERERSISENYQDQIDKLKRSNALIIQRRSEKS